MNVETPQLGQKFEEVSSFFPRFARKRMRKRIALGEDTYGIKDSVIFFFSGGILTEMKLSGDSGVKLVDETYDISVHVLERLRDRFPHTQRFGTRALASFALRRLKQSTASFCTTGEACVYKIKGKTTFVLKGSKVVTVIPTRREFLLYAEVNEKIPYTLLTKYISLISEDTLYITLRS